MLNRRAFLQTAALGGAAFGLGVKLGLGPRVGREPRLVLHGFLPDDDATIGAAVAAFLAAAPGRLPAPVLDVAPRLRGAVAAALRQRTDDFVRGGARVLTVQVTDLVAVAEADVLLQDDGRILDPASQFGRELLALRAAVRGRPAGVAFTARLEDRGETVGGGRILVVENERGLQDRIELRGETRTLALTGPAGRTVVAFGEQGVRVREASCRHRTCQLQGAAAHAGELIACAPNRLLLRVESA
jgi:hypothetical protein